LAPAASTWYSAQHCNGSSTGQRPQAEKRQQAEVHAEAASVLGLSGYWVKHQTYQIRWQTYVLLLALPVLHVHCWASSAALRHAMQLSTVSSSQQSTVPRAAKC
jgi:hypothetical protein